MTDHAATLTATGQDVAAAIESRRVAIVAAYADGWSLPRIAAYVGLSKDGVSKILRNASVTLRPRGGSLPRNDRNLTIS